MNWQTIDPTLPALPFAFDGDAVSQRFEHHWPAQRTNADTRTTVKQCRRQDVTYVPSTRCVTTYSLVAEAAGSAPQPTIGVVEVTPAGLQHRLFTDDPTMPGLALAADAAAMHQQWLARSADGAQAMSAEIYAATPVRYKPGSRCTFRYNLRSARGEERWFGKLLAQDGDQLWQTASTLYQASQQEPELPRISQPLAYWPEVQMLFQAAVPGAELHTFAFDPALDPVTRLDWLHLAGRSIAALHTYSGIEGPYKTLAGDLAGLDEYRPALLQANPALADRFAEAITRLDGVHTRHPELAPVVSHGALRTDQFMLEDDRLVLIDLDSVCWASPARDLGNFLAYLTWKALRQPQHAAFIQHIQQAFLAGYQTLRRLPDTDWLAFYEAASILKIVGRRYTGLTYQEWPLTEQLLDKAVLMIEGNR